MSCLEILSLAQKAYIADLRRHMSKGVDNKDSSHLLHQ